MASFTVLGSVEDLVKVNGDGQMSALAYVSANPSTSCIISKDDDTDPAIEFNDTPSSVEVNGTSATIEPIIGGNFPTGVPGRPKVW